MTQPAKTIPSDQAPGPTQVVSERDLLLLLLAWAAGCTDAVSYLGLGHIFTANMTGNTVVLGMGLGQGNLAVAARSLVALVGFGVGAGLGALIIGRRRRGIPWSSSITLALLAELAVLVVLTIVWGIAGSKPVGAARWGLIALSAVAMGIQSEAVRVQRIWGVATTFVTGTLTNLTAGVVSWLRTESEHPDHHQQDEAVPISPRVWRLLLPAAVWLVYLTGAIAGGATALAWHGAAMIMPLTALTLVIITATLRYHR